MLHKIITLIFSSSLILLKKNCFNPNHAADCEQHLSRPGLTKAKEMAKKREALKQFEKIKSLIIVLGMNLKLLINSYKVLLLTYNYILAPPLYTR